jgi:hypothetical protein
VRGEALRLDGIDDAARVAYRLPEQGTVALWYRPDGFYNFNTVMDNAVAPICGKCGFTKPGPEVQGGERHGRGRV